jgi:hypothetical protein
VGFHQQIGFDLLVGSDRVAFDDEVGGWSGGFLKDRYDKPERGK